MKCCAFPVRIEVNGGMVDQSPVARPKYGHTNTTLVLKMQTVVEWSHIYSQSAFNFLSNWNHACEWTEAPLKVVASFSGPVSLLSIHNFSKKT